MQRVYLGRQPMAEALLDIAGLTVGYGDGIVLSELSLTLQKGKSVAVLGRNGVGKSTLMLAIAGHLKPRSGRISLDGRAIDSVPAFMRTRNGDRVGAAGREVFAPLTVDENLSIAATRPGACGASMTSFRACASAAGTTRTNCRGRAADAGDRTRAGDQPERALAGRAARRPRASGCAG